jgi:hypothetical protein
MTYRKRCSLRAKKRQKLRSLPPGQMGYALGYKIEYLCFFTMQMWKKEARKWRSHAPQWIAA